MIDTIRKTSFRYSFLWKQHINLDVPEEYHFHHMQEVISDTIVRGKLGLDLGCGCGWDTYIMAKNNPCARILGMDISDGVYNAQRLGKPLNNVNIIRGSVENVPLRDGICDFVYSFGVLHHMPEYKKGFSEIRRILKKDSPCFLYLYEDHCENSIKRAAIKLTTLLRKNSVNIHPKILKLICFGLSPFIFIIFTLPSKVLRKFKRTSRIARNLPFNFGTGFFSLWGDLYDRFATPVEHRFSKQDIHSLLLEYGFNKINITKLKNSAGWVAWGYKSNA